MSHRFPKRYVCFIHKTIKKMPHGAVAPICSVCREPMIYINRSDKLPKATDSKSWKALRDAYARSSRS